MRHDRGEIHDITWTSRRSLLTRLNLTRPLTLGACDVATSGVIVFTLVAVFFIVAA